VATDRSTGLLHTKPFVRCPMHRPFSLVFIARSVARGVGRLENTSFGGLNLSCNRIEGPVRQSAISEPVAGPVAKRSSPIYSINEAAPCGAAQWLF
jgi:hypothetical protein